MISNYLLLPKQNRPVIEHIVVMGDSTSDRGTLAKRELLGFIPMKLILSFTTHTHNSRFTNSYTWDDHLGAMLASGMLAKDFKKRKTIFDDTDISDAIINHDIHLKAEIHSAFSLDNDKVINYQAMHFMRTYSEGGLTSADYKRDNVLDPSLEFSRNILSTLAEQRKKLLDDDKSNPNIINERANTLIIEWTGGNDLITVNAEPTTANADKAVKARLENIKELARNGYKRFVLFSLPDLAVTPRYQARSEKERNNAHKVSEYFNRQLIKGINEIKITIPYISINIFDVNETLNKVIANPEEYNFDKDKIKTPFVSSEDYKKSKGGILSAPRYVFWDDIHPSNHVHAILADRFYKQLSPVYKFQAPEVKAEQAQLTPAAIFERFKSEYDQTLKQDKQQLFGFFRRGLLELDLKLAESLDANETRMSKLYIERLAIILNHALNGGGHRTKSILKKQGWIDKDGNVDKRSDALRKANELLVNMPKDAHKRFGGVR